MKYYLGAYASSPNALSWDAQLETQYYDRLKTLTNIEGLEHPFIGSLHPHDEQWFLSHVDPKWNYVFTCVPGIMAAKAANHHFGIASDNESGRIEAINFLGKARDAIETLNKHTGRQAVKAIQIQTSPSKSAARSSVESLQQSLEQISQWDWQGAKIVIEHCDTLIANQRAEKGFLSLDEEIKAVQQCSNQNIGIVINWGRSAIETRSACGVIEHIEKAKEAGVLAGLMFSGASDKDSEYGAWKDTHMPAAVSDGAICGEPTSLMTETEIFKCLKTADAATLDILGIKIGIRPYNTPIEKRVNYNEHVLAILDRYFNP